MYKSTQKHTAASLLIRIVNENILAMTETPNFHCNTTLHLHREEYHQQLAITTNMPSPGR